MNNDNNIDSQRRLSSADPHGKRIVSVAGVYIRSQTAPEASDTEDLTYLEVQHFNTLPSPSIIKIGDEINDSGDSTSTITGSTQTSCSDVEKINDARSTSTVRNIDEAKSCLAIKRYESY